MMMNNFKTILNFLFTKEFLKKFIAYGLLILFFFIFKDFMGMFFLIFIFSYLFYVTGVFIKKYVDNIIDKYCKDPKKEKIFRKIFVFNTIIILEYIIFIIILFFTISSIIPKLSNELHSSGSFVTGVNEIQKNILTYSTKIDEEYGLTITESISNFANHIDVKKVIDVTLGNLKVAGGVIIKILISLLLSFIFILDRKKLKNYLLGIKQSNFKFLYVEYKTIISKIVNSFGLIFKAQAMIASINMILTIIGLIIIGAINGTTFPFILTFGVIVFICGFIPVLGTFISSIPILIIGYTSDFGSLTIVFELIILIVLIHGIEAYILNPKIVSKFLELPVSLTFIILIVSEHLFGIAGLLIGVSLFYFSVGLLNDADKVITKRKKIKTLEMNMLGRLSTKKNK